MRTTSRGDDRRSDYLKAVWWWIGASMNVVVLAAIWGVLNEQNDPTHRAGDLLDGTRLEVAFAGRDATITRAADQAGSSSAALHTDDRRPAASHQALSEARAVVDYLVLEESPETASLWSAMARSDRLRTTTQPKAEPEPTDRFRGD